jgi:hypothetical protein
VTRDNPGTRAPGHYGQRYKILFLDGQRLAAYLARKARPQQQGDDQNNVAKAWLRHCHEHDGNENGGQRQRNIGQAHENGIGSRRDSRKSARPAYKRAGHTNDQEETPKSAS